MVVVGLALDVCVRATALDARRLNYRATVLRSYTKPIAADAGEVSDTVDVLAAAGVEMC